MKPNANRPVLVQILLSFRYAIAGLRLLARDRNMLVHLSACVVAIGLGLWLRVSSLEWILLILTMTLVLSLEAINSAIEYAVDLSAPGWHPLAEKAKDTASAAVLIAAIGACVVGAIIFIPKLMRI